MTPQEFAAVYPLVLRWIRQTITDHAGSAKTVASRGFKRLPSYFSQELLDTTKVIAVPRVPVPPLSSMGLQRFRDFEQGDWDGITYLDTYFLNCKKAAASCTQMGWRGSATRIVHLRRWHIPPKPNSVGRSKHLMCRLWYCAN
jgi:hypothetical protein